MRNDREEAPETVSPPDESHNPDPEESPEEERDSLWKDGIQAAFRSFLDYHYPYLAERVAWERRIHFLEQEQRPRRSRGSRKRRYVDLVARVYEVGENGREGLLHLEVQGQRITQYERQVHWYRADLVARHKKPVTSAVLQTDSSPTWRVADFVETFLGVRVEEPVVVMKLRDWEHRMAEVEASDSVWAVIHLAFLTTLPAGQRRAVAANEALWQVKVRLARRLMAHDLPGSTFEALYKLLDSYLRLPEAEEQQYRAELARLEEAQTMAYLTGIERLALRRGREEGRQEGRQEGQAEGLRKAVLANLEARFGEVPPTAAELLGGVREVEGLYQLVRATWSAADPEAFLREVKRLADQPANGAAPNGARG